MENDQRTFVAGPNGLALELLRSNVWARMDLGLGYRTTPPWATTNSSPTLAASSPQAASLQPGSSEETAARVGVEWGEAVAAAAERRSKTEAREEEDSASSCHSNLGTCLPDHVPWQRVSYINDPLESFAKWPSYGGDGGGHDGGGGGGGGDGGSSVGRSVKRRRPVAYRGVAFFSSQCDPLLAHQRLKRVSALKQALEQRGVRFASFGRCVSR